MFYAKHLGLFFSCRRFYFLALAASLAPHFLFFLSSFLIRVTSINLDGLGAFVYMREGEKWGSNMKNATSRECLISYFLFCFICFPSELGSIHGVRELSLSLRHVAETFFFPSFLFVWGFLLFPSQQHGIAITQRVQSFFCLFFPFFLERRGNTKGYIERDVGGKRTQVGLAIHFFAPFIHSCFCSGTLPCVLWSFPEIRDEIKAHLILSSLKWKLCNFGFTHRASPFLSFTLDLASKSATYSSAEAIREGYFILDWKALSICVCFSANSSF